MKDSEFHEQAMNERAGEGRLRRSTSSAKQSRDQKGSSVIQSDIPGGSIDKDMHCERT